MPTETFSSSSEEIVEDTRQDDEYQSGAETDEAALDSGYSYSDYHGEGCDEADEEIGLEAARRMWDGMQTQAFKEATDGTPALCVPP